MSNINKFKKPTKEYTKVLGSTGIFFVEYPTGIKKFKNFDKAFDFYKQQSGYQKKFNEFTLRSWDFIYLNGCKISFKKTEKPSIINIGRYKNKII